MGSAYVMMSLIIPTEFLLNSEMQESLFSRTKEQHKEGEKGVIHDSKCIFLHAAGTLTSSLTLLMTHVGVSAKNLLSKRGV